MTINLSEKKKVNSLYKKIETLIESYKIDKEVFLKYSTKKNIDDLKKSLNTVGDSRKIDILEDLIEELGVSINNDVYPSYLVLNLVSDANKIRSDFGPGKIKKDLDKQILENEDFLLDYAKENLLNLEKKYYSRMMEVSNYFATEKAIPFSLAAFDTAFFGHSKKDRLNILSKNGVKINSNGKISPYLDIDAIRVRVAALEIADSYVSEVAIKYNELNNGRDNFDKKLKLGNTQFEIYTSKIWKLGNRAYNVCMAKYKKHPLQMIIDNNDQMFIKEVSKVRTKNTKSKELENMERRQLLIDLYKKKKDIYEENQKVIKGEPTKKDLEGQQLTIPEVDELIKKMRNSF